MIPAEVLDALKAAGGTAEMILAVVKADQAIEARARQAKRERDAERKRTSRANKASVSALSHGQTVTSRDGRGQGVTARDIADPPRSNTPPVKKDTSSGPRGPSDDAEGASDDPRQRLFSSGREALEKLTGKTPDSCRSLIGRWLKVVDDEAIHVLGAIEDACRGPPADPTAWITARLQSLKRTEALNGRGRQSVAAGGESGSPITRAIQGHIRAISGEDDGGGERDPRASRLLSHR